MITTVLDIKFTFKSILKLKKAKLFILRLNGFKLALIQGSGTVHTIALYVKSLSLQQAFRLRSPLFRYEVVLHSDLPLNTLLCNNKISRCL